MKKKNDKGLSVSQQIYAEFLAKEESTATAAGELGFMVRAMVQTTMPHSKPKELNHLRRNGNFSIHMAGHPDYGLPFGVIPRFIIAYITTKALQTKSRHIPLGQSLSQFMEALDMVPTGGRWGSITRLRDQLNRLATTSIVCVYDESNRTRTVNQAIISQADLWWDIKDPNQSSLFESELYLGEEFYNEIIKSSVPVDMNAFRRLSKSPLAIDAYCWLTHRMSYLSKTTVVPWEALQFQFGSNYTHLKGFKFKFKNALLKVAQVYPEARMYLEDNGLMLKPSRPHINKK